MADGRGTRATGTTGHFYEVVESDEGSDESYSLLEDLETSTQMRKKTKRRQQDKTLELSCVKKPVNDSNRAVSEHEEGKSFAGEMAVLDFDRTNERNVTKRMVKEVEPEKEEQNEEENEQTETLTEDQQFKNFKLRNKAFREETGAFQKVRFLLQFFR